MFQMSTSHVATTPESTGLGEQLRLAQTGVSTRYLEQEAADFPCDEGSASKRF